MKIHHRISYKLWTRLICLLLSAALLCSCAGGGKNTGKGSGPDQETQSTETSPHKSETGTEHGTSSGQTAADILNSEEARRAQQTFENLCENFFKEQVSESYLTLHYTLKDPEKYGITDYDISFGDFSLAKMQESQKKQNELQTALNALDINLLTDSQKLTYRILTRSLEYEDAGEGLELYYQPLTPSTGVQAQLPVLLTEYTFYEKEDVDHYLTLLADIDRYYQQILDFEKEKSASGLSLPDACIDQIVTESEAYLLAPEHNLMVTGFDRRIDEMTTLTDEEKAAYKQQNMTIVSEDFIPAYELLLNGLKELKGTCTNQQGLCYSPEGKAYYEYLVHSSTGTTFSTIDQLKKAIEMQIDDDLLAISQILNDHPEVTSELANYRFSETDPTKILELLKELVKDDFPEITDYSYTTKYVPEELEQTLSPAFFLVPPIDIYDNCVIYINGGSTSGSDSLFTTLAHEGIPGHLYQNVYFLSNCSSNVRKILSFSGYTEGWATYVEHYAYTLDNGLSPELGTVLAHNSSATLGIHALLDLNVNYYGWDMEKTAGFLNQYFDISDSNVVESIYQAVRNDPVNYLNYYVGYLEIAQMRELAEETLKDQFQPKAFHQFILDMGPAPFTVMAPYFKTWLMTYHM